MNRNEAGFTYLVVLAMVFALLLGLSVTSEHVGRVNQREREAELVFIGLQYCNAIASYYHNSPDGNKQLPLTLESLLADSRAINHLHHLRKFYRDPITENPEWGLIKTQQGEIMGVYSLSNDQVLSMGKYINLLKNATICDESSVKNSAILNATSATYQDWKFIFKPEDKDSLLISNDDENSSKDADEILDSSAQDISDF